MSSPTPKLKFDQIRQRWIEAALKSRPDGSSVLDVGAGECANRVYARHLDYTSQDIAQYDGSGDGAGLQTGQFDFSQIDIVCDLLDIPEDRKFDTILFVEVLEHVPDPAAALAKLGRLLNEGGELILTAPFWWRSSSLSSTSCAVPSKTTSPVSRIIARSASLSAAIAFCSTMIVVMPSALRTSSVLFDFLTMTGARPS
jgi:2-polyprenyl-3-methyl-5-hydroxy-6-metoxy-1,4-benzoquinol methylase